MSSFFFFFLASQFCKRSIWNWPTYKCVTIFVKISIHSPFTFYIHIRFHLKFHCFHIYQSDFDIIRIYLSDAKTNQKIISKWGKPNGVLWSQKKKKIQRPYCMTIAIDSSFNVTTDRIIWFVCCDKISRMSIIKVFLRVFFLCCSFVYYNRNWVGHSLF